MSRPVDPAGSPADGAVDLDAFLVRELPRLRAFLRLRGGEAFRARESLSDLVQSVCRELLQHRARFQHGGADGLRRWLFCEAERKIADRFQFHRAARRDPAKEVAHEPAADESMDDLLDFYASSLTPSRHAMGREEILRVETRFQQLAPDRQQVILLCKVQGLSAAEAGALLGRSATAVRVLLSRALADLAELLHAP